MTTSNPNISTPSPQSNRFNLVPTTLSQLDPTILRSANEALITNIRAGILDTLTKAYIPKLASLVEQLRATAVMVQRNYNDLTAIVKQRKVIAHGKRVILKDQTLVTSTNNRGIVSEDQSCKTSNAGKKTFYWSEEEEDGFTGSSG